MDHAAVVRARLEAEAGKAFQDAGAMPPPRHGAGGGEADHPAPNNRHVYRCGVVPSVRRWAILYALTQVGTTTTMWCANI